MYILFRCNNCETINKIPITRHYTLCKKCSKIIIYEPGESILVDENDIPNSKFFAIGNLSESNAQEFFNLADKFYDEVKEILKNYNDKSVTYLDINSSSIPDIILSIIKQNEEHTLDFIIEHCRLFDISILNLEKIILKMKREGIIYQPKNWLIMLA